MSIDPRGSAPSRGALAALLCALALCGAEALAADGTPPAKSAKGKAHAAKPHVSGKAKFDKGSGETAAQRDRRLQRECKGLPNAGACLGYASP
ncbi:hypothetical protein [Variovorax terrae]|uniref:PsiF repeat-containing protein n=1 Tax=Variovorax terrae TaxID=2923278 RepID=A0A9X2ANK7_9BURK|nr:hypothetical protein [Variovorax terrae]MCJ0762532.1 hypothetical protein [Variovorax terrae]